MTYHNESNLQADYFQAAYRGQEFVIAGNKTDIVKKHLKQLIKNNTFKTINNRKFKL